MLGLRVQAVEEGGVESRGFGKAQVGKEARAGVGEASRAAKGSTQPREARRTRVKRPHEGYCRFLPRGSGTWANASWGDVYSKGGIAAKSGCWKG
ncbi:hypothetical protein TJA_16380 [Thermus sp. LT1-2-5]